MAIVVGASGTILTSTNNVTWTARTSGVAVQLNAVAGMAANPSTWAAAVTPSNSWTKETETTSSWTNGAQP